MLSRGGYILLAHAAVGVIAASTSADADRPIYVLFTVDVESFTHGNPERDIWGRLEGQPEDHGIVRMMDIFDKHGAKATFFVNVYEAATHGQDALSEVCRAIHARGHDLELHTHPKPMFGVSGMSQTDLDTQAKILRRGMDLLRQWTGAEVVAHRAGGYAANRDTVTACKAAGIEMDFSLVRGGEGCPLAGQVATTNAAAVICDTLEILVTSYVQASCGRWRSTRFLDIEASSPDEIRKVVADLRAHGVRTAVIMMHSFSFIRFGEPNERVERALDEIVADFVADPNVRLVTARELYDIWQSDLSALEGNDYLPTTGWWMTYKRAWIRLDEGWKNLAVALTPPGGIALLAATGGTVLLWRRSRRRKRGTAA